MLEDTCNVRVNDFWSQSLVVPNYTCPVLLLAGHHGNSTNFSVSMCVVSDYLKD